ncbi:dihydroorotate dehydrogenase [Conoideocrella luteorostrata]|uniref:Dihydroorotate dehydrogenase n=1 Tax=Conoideocrella luteorostrata TaxID=1105319 RepID=A0AAJ0CCR6_9HYPO|nr:dihydroorotate dehydrogenase [Conoideocrella luteorostrata]
MPPPRLSLHPPLFNTACPWATTEADLAALLESPSIGAITTRTSLIDGFPHDDAIHRHRFLDPATHAPVENTHHPSKPVTSVNNFGYSPRRLEYYLAVLEQLSHTALSAKSHSKTAIISVTGTPSSVAECYALIVDASAKIVFPLAMEINLSCPNIPDSPPPAHNSASLTRYLDELPAPSAIPIGIKVPPYTYSDQFSSLISTLEGSSSKVSFLTATNTLGGCMALNNDGEMALPSADGLGGLAGASLHALAVGNVATLRRLLDGREALRHVVVLGVGGVSDGLGYGRMRRAGAAAVGVATALGAQGVGVFERIEADVCSAW